MDCTRKLHFERVTGTKSQIKVLYHLLEQRQHSISHVSMPTFEVHTEFVLSEPYVHWYIVCHGEEPIASFYIHSDNSIGLNLIDPRENWLREILTFLMETHTPQPAVPSRIPPYFYINVPYDNAVLKKMLSELGHEPIQTSYRLNAQGS